MADEHASQELEIRRQYGDTTLTGTSRAHFGDNLNQYSINRDLHVHLGSPAALSATSAHQKNIEQVVFEKLQYALAFHEEKNRFLDIKPAHNSTFDWIFQTTNNGSDTHFHDWLSHGRGLYWFNGKAGSGKSTLMKYIARHQLLRPLLQKWAAHCEVLIATFFFWHAGSPLQKSLEGVLRSLLRQIVQARPGLMNVMFERFVRGTRQQTGNPQNSREPAPPSMLELQDALDSFSLSGGDDIALFLLVDGVHEYEGDYLEFAKLLVRLSTSQKIKVLVSSRPVPECFHVFSEHPQLRLQDLTRPDMEKYIEDELMKNQLLIRLEGTTPGLRHQLKHTLIEKSSGVFLWVILVVRRIVIGLIKYDSRYEIMASVDELPSDLGKLYDHMFAKMDIDHQREGSLLLQLMSSAQEGQTTTITALQFGLAADRLHESYAVSDHPRPDVEFSDEEAYVEILAGRLRSRCCGLVEIEDYASRGLRIPPKTMFLHRTVFEYLQDHTVKNKLSEVVDIPQYDMDMSLLLACVRLLKHWQWHMQGDLFTDSPCFGLFIASIQYAYSLKECNTADYSAILYAAEQSFRYACHLTSSTDMQYGRSNLLNQYKKAWQDSLQHQTMTELPEIPRTLLKDQGHATLVKERLKTQEGPDYVVLQIGIQLGMFEYVSMHLRASTEAKREAISLLAVLLSCHTDAKAIQVLVNEGKIHPNEMCQRPTWITRYPTASSASDRSTTGMKDTFVYNWSGRTTTKPHITFTPTGVS